MSRLLSSKEKSKRSASGLVLMALFFIRLVNLMGCAVLAKEKPSTLFSNFMGASPHKTRFIPLPRGCLWKSSSIQVLDKKNKAFDHGGLQASLQTSTQVE